MMLNFVSMWRSSGRQGERVYVDGHGSRATAHGVVRVRQVVVLELAQLMVAAMISVQVLQLGQLHVGIARH